MSLHPERDQILETLFTTITRRKNQLKTKGASPGKNSYTQTLFKNGLKAIIAKVTEEINETIEAATTLDQLTNQVPNDSTTDPTSNKGLPDTFFASNKNVPPHNKPVTAEPTMPPINISTQALTAAQAHLIHELADVIYHLFVLTAYSNIDLSDIKKELYKRHSG